MRPLYWNIIYIFLTIFVIYQIYYRVWIFHEGLETSPTDDTNKSKMKDQTMVFGIENTKDAIKQTNDKYLVQTLSLMDIANYSKPKTISLNETRSLKIPMETNSTVSFIIIRPNNNSTFPKHMELSIENDIQKNNMEYPLLGETTDETIPQNNSIEVQDIKDIPYPKNTFFKNKDGIFIQDIPMGKKILHIFTIGAIFNNKYTSVGNVDSQNNKIKISCDIGDQYDSILVVYGEPSETM